jgi:hypothetical protein
MRASGQAGRPDGRTELREEIYARTHAHTHARWAIEGRIRTLRVKRSVQYVSLVRQGDRDQAGHKRAKLLRLVQDNSETTARTLVHLTWTTTNVSARVRSKSVSTSKTNENCNVCAIKYKSDMHKENYDVSNYNVEY